MIDTTPHGPLGAAIRRHYNALARSPAVAVAVDPCALAAAINLARSAMRHGVTHRQARRDLERFIMQASKELPPAGHEFVRLADILARESVHPEPEVS